ncbi:MAG: hypothetical protein Q9M16_04130 [Mariprofundus sp.]|nr:hypothetical protein [Mariprofundus sp.]
MRFIHRIGEIAVDDNVATIGNDQQRRTLQCHGITLQLLIGFIQILAGAFVFPIEMATFPDISPTITATGLFCALFKTEPFTGLIGIGRVLFPQQSAQVIKMRLGCRAFF